MKLKIYVIKKKQLIWAALILAVIIIAAILLISLRTRQAINTISPTKNTIYADINDDGKNDSIVLNTDDKTGKYIVDVISSDGNGYSLEPDPAIKTLGYYTSWWPMKVTVLDINNDKNSEIILQSADGNGPVLHVFRCIDGKTERLASGRYSVFGMVKSPEDKTNLFVLGTKKGTNIQMTFLGTKSGKLAPHVIPTAFTLGRDTLSSLVAFMEKDDVEASNINMENKLISKVLKGSYLDGRLLEAKYGKYNIPSECIYIIRTSNSDSGEKETLTYRARLSLTKYDANKPEYRITQLDIVK